MPGKDHTDKAGAEEKDETVVVKTERPDGSSPAPDKPVSDPAGSSLSEKSEKEKPVPKGPAKSQPAEGLSDQKTQPDKQGASMKYIKIGSVLLLILGAGVFFYIRQSNQGYDSSRWMPLGPTTQQVGPSGVSPYYDRVQLGMSTDSVRRILGEPKHVKTLGQLIEWEYDTGSGLFEVRFQKSNVVFKGMVAYHATSSPSQPSSTTQGYGTPNTTVGSQDGFTAASPGNEQIRLGMSPDSVMQILGQPMKVKTLGHLIEWEYDTGTGLLEIRFQRGKVVFSGMVAYHATDIPAQSISTTPVYATPDAAGTGQEGLPTSLPNYDQVQMGASMEMVRQMLGEPMKTVKVGQTIEWEYDTGAGLFEVRFRSGNAVYRGMSPYHGSQTRPATSPSPPATAGTATGGPKRAVEGYQVFDTIQLGMSPDTVRQILGEPTEVKRLRQAIEWEYGLPHGVFEVRFKNDRVVFSGMAPQPAKKGR